MTDPDDKVTRRYRELAREEPGAALDAAILAASRRAVARPSAARRWGAPVSIAAVLMLAVGVSLNMQREQPGVEYAEPARPSAAPAAKPPAEPAPPQDRVQSLERRDAAPAAPSQAAPANAVKREERFAIKSPKSKNIAPTMDRAVEEKLEKKDSALADGAAERPVPRPNFVPEPAAPAAPPAASLAAAPARAAASGAVATPRAKSEADSLEKNVRAQVLPLAPEQELERIARLRAEGRHAEADKALEEFRRRHPDFRIPEAMLERVRRPSSLPSTEQPR